MSDVVKKHKKGGLSPSSNSDWLAYANSVLAEQRFAGLDQNPKGIRDLFAAAETTMRNMELRIARLEKEAFEAGWRETARQQERSGGTM